MKRMIAMLSFALAICACGGTVTDDNPVIGALREAVGQGRFYYGHQDDLMYGHSWNATLDGDRSAERSDVRDVCGAYPAVLGLDLGDIETGAACNLDGNDFDLMRETIIRHHERGGLVTLSWHMRNPRTGGDAWDNSDSLTVPSVLEGGENHAKFLGWLDAGADFIGSLKDEDGNQIPVIFRPWHEHNGSWFWWGCATTTPDQYNALWRMTHDHFTETRGLGGLVWEISPGAKPVGFDSWQDRYPGDGYVDILGLDCYMDTGMEPYEAAVESYLVTVREGLSSLKEMCLGRGKILAFSETGFEGVPDPQWWTSVLMKAVEGFPVSYVLTWRNASDRENHYYAPWKGQASAADFADFADNDKTIFLK